MEKQDDENSNFKITELFLVKADWFRTFIGQILKEKTEDNNLILRGNVIVNEGKIWSVADSEQQLGKNLDELCKLKLDYYINAVGGIKETVVEIPFYLN